MLKPIKLLSVDMSSQSQLPLPKDTHVNQMLISSLLGAIKTAISCLPTFQLCEDNIHLNILFYIIGLLLTREIYKQEYFLLSMSVFLLSLQNNIQD